MESKRWNERVVGEEAIYTGFEKRGGWDDSETQNYEAGAWFLRKETFSTETFSTPLSSVFSWYT